MNMKSLILGGAALVAATGAQAADLGRPAPAAVDYVKVCDAYGTGFFYIPGTETCIKIGGYVRAEYRVGDSEAMYRDSGSRTNFSSQNAARLGDGVARDRLFTRARADLTVDTRTNTEFGLLRSYFDVYWTTQTFNPRPGGGAGSGVPATDLEYAFIQFGGLTAGRAQSFFDFFWGYTYTAMYGVQGYGTYSAVNLLAYTFSFGNGVSATLSLEDPSTGIASRRRGGTGIANEAVVADGLGLIFPVGTAIITNARQGLVYGGLKYPDVVANVNIAQAWGSAQLMAAAHHLQPNAARLEDGWGWAVGAGVKVNLPMLGAGDQLALQAVWSDGAVGYANGATFLGGSTLSTTNPGSIFLPGVVGSLGNIGADAVYQGRNLRTTEAWNVSAGFKHNFSTRVEANINGSYTDVDGFGQRDFAQTNLGANVIWKPAAGLGIGVGLEYQNIDFSGGTIAQYSSPGSNINFNRRLRDGDAWVGLLRVQRSF